MMLYIIKYRTVGSPPAVFFFSNKVVIEQKQIQYENDQKNRIARK